MVTVVVVGRLTVNVAVLLLVLCVASPLYVPVMVCAPNVEDAVIVTAQVPAERVQLAALKPSPISELVIVTVPVGVVTPGAALASATVIVTVPVWPGVALVGLTVTVTVLARFVTVSDAVPLLVLCDASPL
jgi:hypothetical protein